jgi:hypothetical protein
MAWEWDQTGFASFLIDKRMAACRVVHLGFAHPARSGFLRSRFLSFSHKWQRLEACYQPGLNGRPG